MTDLCPCQSAQQYSQCCGQYIDGDAQPKTPEALMRSRYTAYTQANIDYIQQTMKGRANQGFYPEQSKEWAQQAAWLRLEVLNTEHPADDLGFVEFIAYYRFQGVEQALHENSEFHRENGRWFYVGMKAKTNPNKLGRNDPCACGSGKKFKKCCG